jgi:hypothetical protein
VFVRQPDKQKRSRCLGCVDTLISQSRVAVAKEWKGAGNSLWRNGRHPTKLKTGD